VSADDLSRATALARDSTRVNHLDLAREIRALRHSRSATAPDQDCKRDLNFAVLACTYISRIRFSRVRFPVLFLSLISFYLPLIAGTCINDRSHGRGSMGADISIDWISFAMLFKGSIRARETRSSPVFLDRRTRPISMIVPLRRKRETSRARHRESRIVFDLVDR